jgi:hypothetical protein
MGDGDGEKLKLGKLKVERGDGDGEKLKLGKLKAEMGDGDGEKLKLGKLKVERGDGDGEKLNVETEIGKTNCWSWVFSALCFLLSAFCFSLWEHRSHC